MKLIRENPELFDREMARRGINRSFASVSRRAVQLLRDKQLLETWQHRRNELAGLIGRAKSKGEEPDAALMEEATTLATATPELHLRTQEDERGVNGALALIPNFLAEDVPEGADENENVEIHRRPGLYNGVADPLEHDAIGALLGMDFEAGTKLSGSRFTVLRGDMARVARGLGQMMLDLHTEHHDYIEVAPPVLVRREALYGTGQFPKFEEDVFPAGRDHFLAPTSEVMLTNLVAGEMLDVADLPLRMTALTECFRLEAGSAGRDTRGIIRQHQFQKVELVAIVTPDQAADEHERMTACAEAVLAALGLPYRRVLLCAGDTGFSARRTYDLEVWMAGAKRWREISSVSWCGDFQARRMGTRVKLDKKSKVYAHTLNGSGVAIGRALAAILEYYQIDGKSVSIPDRLRHYTGGVKRLEAY